jgi:hypothetical protein
MRRRPKRTVGSVPAPKSNGEMRWHGPAVAEARGRKPANLARGGQCSPAATPAKGTPRWLVPGLRYMGAWQKGSFAERVRVGELGRPTGPPPPSPPVVDWAVMPASGMTATA